MIHCTDIRLQLCIHHQSSFSRSKLNELPPKITESFTVIVAQIEISSCHQDAWWDRTTQNPKQVVIRYREAQTNAWGNAHQMRDEDPNPLPGA